MMEISAQDCLKKTLLDTQERVRDFMNYADKFDDKRLKAYFRQYAEIEGKQAEQLRTFIQDGQNH